MDKIKQLLEDFKVATSIPSIKLNVSKKANIAITDSKLGGNPYLPKDYVYPSTSEGVPLKLLAQLNFSQLPQLENFPKEGIIQFYVLPDGVVGLGEEDRFLQQESYKIIYHKEVLPASLQMHDFPQIRLIDNGYGTWFPFEGEFYLSGSLDKCHMTTSTYEFEQALTDFSKERGMESLLAPFFCTRADAQKNMSNAEFEEFDRKRQLLINLVYDTMGNDEAHRISGYPAFTQEDPRGYNVSLQSLDVLLFQLASEYVAGDYEIMWGDMGVANFLINSDKLKNCDFSEVLYTWGCG